MANEFFNPEVERLAAELADLTGESSSDAVRKALQERKDRLSSTGLIAELPAEPFPPAIQAAAPSPCVGRPLTRNEFEELFSLGIDDL